MRGRYWEHPVIRDYHVVRMTRSYPDNVPHSVATCQCGWASTFRVTEYTKQDAAIGDHWRAAIAQTEGEVA